ncbi:DNA/RNA helicase domain-containing protein [Streptomyces sp. NPDC059649]|uniref:DNA/RNA helicase domain-containing protein n=1 Tax=Streptomyces sp. NPDC059649 TaxID=3346895 RepID=UPI0036A7EE65
MTLLRVSAGSLAEEAKSVHRPYVESLENEYFFTYRKPPSEAEVRSWRESLAALAQLLVSARLGDVEMLIEYRLPMCSLRADAVLAGVHPVSGEPSYVVVELKQWSAARMIPGSNDLCDVPGIRPRRALLHPVSQVGRYREYLVDLTQIFDGGPERVDAAAFLHNAKSADVSDLLATSVAGGRLFTATTRDEFAGFLRERIQADPERRAGDALLQSRHSPALKLMEVAADQVMRREHFRLLGDQQKAFSLTLRTLEKVRNEGLGGKEVVLITGGPGSGKSVIALSLMGHLLRHQRRVAHATGSKSFTKTLHKMVSGERHGVAKLFTYFNSFDRARPNDLEVLILDEAHRLRETSNGAPAGSKWAVRRQIEEVLDAAQVPVFLLDQHQVVRPGETGTVEAIEKAAADRGLTVRHVDLNGQFRCGGSRSYETWVLKLLGLEPGGPERWLGDESFDVCVAESPEQLERFLQTKRDQGMTARMAAGFCWPWSPPRKDGTLVNDVTIGPWQRPWNVNDPSGAGGNPPSDLWATDPAGFGQIGCIYTAQGFEYDWSGVILGPDLLWRSGGWIVDPTASEDPAIKNHHRGRRSSATASRADLARLIRNTYKVLLTRGMAGTILYSPDDQTRAKLFELVRRRVPA